jgi:hypothetical protein
MLDVVRRVIHELESGHPTGLLFVVGNVPKTPARGSGIGMLTRPAALLGIQVEMEANLVLEIAIVSSPSKHNSEAVAPPVET